MLRRSFLFIIGAVAAIVPLGRLATCSDRIAIDLIEPLESVRLFREKYLTLLTDSIARNGLMMSVTIAMHEGKYYCVDGLHRVEACRRLGWLTVPCRFLVVEDWDLER